jgi:hypothetical protein
VTLDFPYSNLILLLYCINLGINVKASLYGYELVEKTGRKKYIQRGMEEVPENGKELSHSARANGMDE